VYGNCKKEVQKDRKTYTPRIPSDEPFFVRSQAKKPGNKKLYTRR